MSFADQLTVARAISVPIVVALFAIPFPHHDLWATGVFCAAMATDWFDGRIARRTGRTSSFGSLLDPVADKLLVMAARDLGKLKTWSQALAAALGGLAAAGVVRDDVAWWALLVALVLTWVSGLDYARSAPRVPHRRAAGSPRRAC